jgi:hypothetical protein
MPEVFLGSASEAARKALQEIELARVSPRASALVAAQRIPQD